MRVQGIRHVSVLYRRSLTTLNHLGVVLRLSVLGSSLVAPCALVLRRQSCFLHCSARTVLDPSVSAPVLDPERKDRTDRRRKNKDLSQKEKGIRQPQGFPLTFFSSYDPYDRYDWHGLIIFS